MSLDAAAQALLALWSGKTAIALIAADETVIDARQLVPIEHRRAIRNEGRLGDDVWVGYFPWRGSPVVSVGEVVATGNVDPAHRLNAYGAILTFAQLGFEVFGLTGPLPPGFVLEADSPSMRQFWPPARPLIDWPLSGPAATYAALDALLNFAPVRPHPG